MKRSLIALLTLLFVFQLAVHGQSDHTRFCAKEITKAEELLNQPGEFDTFIADSHDLPQNKSGIGASDQLLGARLIELLKVLEGEVITYNSLGEYQDSGKLARVPWAVFRRDLQKVSAEAAVLLSLMPQTRLKSEINNALLSYQDGGFWWERADAPRVVNVSNFSPENNRTPADTNYSATIPYTIVINWRHGRRYIRRAEKILEQYSKVSRVALTRKPVRS